MGTGTCVIFNCPGAMALKEFKEARESPAGVAQQWSIDP